MFHSLLFVLWFCGSTSFHFWEASLSVVSVFGITLKRSFPTKIIETLDFCFLLVILWFHTVHQLICSSIIRWCVFCPCLPNPSHSIYYSTLPHWTDVSISVLTSALGFVTDSTESLEKTLGKNFTSRYQNFPNKWHLRYKSNQSTFLLSRGSRVAQRSPWQSGLALGSVNHAAATRTPASRAEFLLLSSLLAPQGCAPATPLWFFSSWLSIPWLYSFNSAIHQFQRNRVLVLPYSSVLVKLSISNY